MSDDPGEGDSGGIRDDVPGIAGPAGQEVVLEELTDRCVHEGQQQGHPRSQADHDTDENGDPEDHGMGDLVRAPEEGRPRGQGRVEPFELETDRDEEERDPPHAAGQRERSET